MALSICDVCRKDPDRGVDLILSVQVYFANCLSISYFGFHSKLSNVFWITGLH